METTFIKARNFSDYAFSVSVFLFGLTLVLVPTSFGMNVVGGVIIVTGMIMFFALRSVWKDVRTGDLYRGRVLYFNNSKKQAVMEALADELSKLSEIPQENKAYNSLRLYMYYNKRKGKCYCELYEYVPCEYVPLTELLLFKIGGGFRRTSLNCRRFGESS